MEVNRPSVAPAATSTSAHMVHHAPPHRESNPPRTPWKYYNYYYHWQYLELSLPTPTLDHIRHIPTSKYKVPCYSTINHPYISRTAAHRAWILTPVHFLAPLDRHTPAAHHRPPSPQDSVSYSILPGIPSWLCCVCRTERWFQEGPRVQFESEAVARDLGRSDPYAEF